MNAVSPISNVKKFLFTSIIFFSSLVLILIILLKEYLYDASYSLQDTEIKGLNASVEVSIHSLGVPEINAHNEQDLYFMMGYLHARDRLWQMEVQKRLSAGRLSELFGKASINQDIWMRTLGLTQWAEKTFNKMKGEPRLSLEQYSRGVNYWIERNEKLPIEFRIFDIQPEAWTPIDSLSWIKMFSLNLSGNYRQEIQRLVSMKYLKEEDLNVFFPETHFSEAFPLEDTELTSLKKMLAPIEALEAQFNVGGKNVGSNAWVVAGQHTVTGSPILANDPHLGLQIPSLWYAVKQKTPTLEVSGMSLVGLPLVIFGRNQSIAWGGTNMMADVQDLTIEQLHPTHPNLYREGDNWVPFVERVEAIHVRQDFPASLRNPLAPIEIVVKETVRGPIINDRAGFEGLPLSLQWVSLTDDDTTYDAFYDVNRAKNWQGFLQAMSQHVAPALNLFYADQNNIGYKAVGRLPKRKNSNGAMPMFAQNSQWQGFVPFAAMPEQFNPEQGFLLNANNRIGDGFPYVISNDFAHPARAKRIEQRLTQFIQSEQPISVKHMQALQHDTLDLSAQPLVALMQGMSVQNDKQAQALAFIKAWDLHADANSVAATLYYTWLFHLKQQLLGDELSGYWNTPADKAYLSGLPARVRPEMLAMLLQKTREHNSATTQWCDGLQTSSQITSQALSQQSSQISSQASSQQSSQITSQTLSPKASTTSCEWVMQSALSAAIHDLEGLYGNDMEDWRWGEAQQTLYSHMPFSQMKVVDTLFERRVGTAGAPNAIHASTSTYNDIDGFETVFGAGFRQVMSMTPEGPAHYLMNSTGQSGRWGSDHYDDMVLPFSQNQLMDMNDDAVSQRVQFTPAAQ